LIEAASWLEKIKPATGEHWKTKRGGDSPHSRKAAADAAGISADQRKMMQRNSRGEPNVLTAV
jgi:hypothetical protein